MAVTVIDSTDMPAILADAGVEVDKPAKVDNEADKVDKTGVKGVEHNDDPDDIEGDDGLTPRQKREFTQNMQKTIGKKHRQMKEAEEFAADQYNGRRLAEQRAQQLEEELAAERAKSAPPKQEAKAPEKPDRANFSNEGEFIEAMIQYGVDQRLAEKEAADAKAKADAAREEAINTAKGRIAKAIELVPDFSDVVQGNDTMVPPAVAGYMQKSEMFAELAYHLAKNPDLLVSLSKLDPDMQLVKIGKIESTLQPFGSKVDSQETQDDSKSSSAASNGRAYKPAPSADTDIDLSKPRGKAAPVITPLDATGSAGASKDSKDMNIRETIEDYSKRNRVNLNIRKRH
jgi:hypothetical protein